MRVVNQRRWQRTKYQTATVLLIISIACAGGLESIDGTETMPSRAGFIISISLLAALTYNIMRKEHIS